MGFDGICCPGYTQLLLCVWLEVAHSASSKNGVASFFICKVGHNYMYTPSIWWNSCQKYCIYTVYIYGSGQLYTVDEIPAPTTYTLYIYGSGQPYLFVETQHTYYILYIIHTQFYTHAHTHTHIHTHTHTHTRTHAYAQVGTDDNDLRVYRNEDVIAETSEAERFVALCPMDNSYFGYGLVNGTIGAGLS